MLPWEEPLLAIDREGLHFTHCLGCGQDNPAGLKLDFRRDGETARAEFIPGEVHQGWPNFVHGGLLCTILDEAIGYACLFLGLRGVTGKLEVRIRRPVPIGEPLLIAAAITKRTRKLITARSTINFADGTPVAEGTALIYVLPEGHSV